MLALIVCDQPLPRVLLIGLPPALQSPVTG